MIYTKNPKGIVFEWDDSQTIPENHVLMTSEEVEAHLNPPPPPVTMEQAKQVLQKHCDGIAVAMDGDYKNSTEVLVYASMGDTQAKVFADWYNTVWDSKASLTSPPQDVDGWLKSLPCFVVGVL